MHKPLKRFYNYLAKAFDKKTDKMDVERREREEKISKTYWVTESYEDYLEALRIKRGLPPLDAKNPYRFM